MLQSQITFATRSLQTTFLKTEILPERSGLPKDSKNPQSPPTTTAPWRRDSKTSSNCQRFRPICILPSMPLPPNGARLTGAA